MSHKLNVNLSANWMESPTFKDYFNSAGRGFIMGQGFAAFSSASHAIFHAPSGSRFKDFVSQFSQQSFQNGTNMAHWSIVQLTVDPIIRKTVPNPFLQNIVGGAVTGALIEWRNGTKGMAIGAIQGAGQSLMMAVVGPVIGFVAKPITEMHAQKKVREFHEGRSNRVFQSPQQALREAFFHTR